MKILFVLEYYHPHIGGVETLFQSLAEELSESGHEIVILTNRYDKSLPALEKLGNISIHRYRFFNRYLFTFLAWLPGLRLADKSVDLVHTTSYNAALPAWIIAKLRGKKIIITFHEYWGELWQQLPWMPSWMKWTFARFERMISRLGYDKIVAVSDSTATALKGSGIAPHQVTRIYNGIEYAQAESHTDSARDVKQYLYFGRAGYSKGLDLLLPACAQLWERGETFHLTMVVSQDHQYPTVAKMIDDLGVRDQINMRHNLSRSDLNQLITQSDAVIIPSYSEGFCYAAVETMEIGTPIISSGQGALAEVVCGQHITVEAFDVGGLSRAIGRALTDDWDHTPTRRYELSDTIAAYIALYKELT